MKTPATEQDGAPIAESSLVPSSIAKRLESLRVDFEKVCGSAFNHFYCPVLYVDEPVPLCRAHIVNQAFGGAPRNWTVQRRDVDVHFGSRFEADFTLLAHKRQILEGDGFVDGKIAKRLTTRVLAGKEEIPHFPATGPSVDGFTPLQMLDSGRLVYLKMPPEEVDRRLEEDWSVETTADFRVGAAVSLIKSAHLTLFSLLGYRYVFSAGAALIGRDLLGAIFKDTMKCSLQQAQERAKEQLREWVHVGRPILSDLSMSEGTVVDRLMLVAWTASDRPWAAIVKVPIGEDASFGVLMPCCDGPDEVVTYLDFLKNDREEIRVKLARLVDDREGGRLEVSEREYPLRWPKTGATFD